MLYSEDIPPLGYYYHYKHDPEQGVDDYAYEVVGLARHSESKEWPVLYRPLYRQDYLPKSALTARPLEMFMENVTQDGNVVKRFRKIEDASLFKRFQSAVQHPSDPD